MNAASAHNEAAFQVLEILTSTEEQQWVLERGLAIPSREALSDNPYFQQDDPEAQANYAFFLGASDGNVLPFIFVSYGGDWTCPIDQALSAVMSKQATVEEARLEAQQRLDAVMGR